MAEVQPVTSPAPLRLKDVFLRARWQHVILLTYSFDLPFFESYLLRLLVDGGAKMITVAADARWLADSLPRWLKGGDVREAGRSYTLSPVRVPGAFHPKLVLAADESSGTVLLGSGNMSAYGLATGGELFTLCDWQDSQVPPIAQEAWRTCVGLVEALAIEPLLAQRIQAIGRLVPALASRPKAGYIRNNLTEPLLDQFISTIGERKVSELLLWSPFTDRHLDALCALVDRLHPGQVTVALQPGLTGLDGQRMIAIASERAGIDWRFIELQENKTLVDSRRQLIHAKGILAVLESGEELLLAGSPNLSTPALLKSTKEGNFEIATLIQGQGLYKSLFNESGPIHLGDPVDLGTVSWSDEPSVASADGGVASVELLGARWDGAVLTLTVRGNCPRPAEVLIDGLHRLPVQFVNSSLQVTLPPGMAALGIELNWDGGRSGPVIVADLPRLAALARGGEARTHTPLGAVDYGGDSDLLALLDQLAQLAIISTSDIDSIVRGRSAPTQREEADEVNGNDALHELGDIDFDTVRQHPRGRGYESTGHDEFDAPRLQLHLDEVVQQFDMLREKQLLRVVKPIVSQEDPGEDDGELGEEPAREVRRWSVSRRVRVRVLNRVRRYVMGVGDPRFWRLIDSGWMAKNYILFLGFLERLWQRTEDPGTLILTPDDLASLSLDLLSAFWGSDERDGYWAHLTDEDALDVAGLLEEHMSIALTIATSIRLLSLHGYDGRIAPFVTSGFVRCSERFGLLTLPAAEAALVYLDQPDRDPMSVLDQLRATKDYFTWDRYLYLLTKLHHVRKVAVANRGYASGEAMVVDASERLDDHPAPLAILADWIDVTVQRGSVRRIFQVIWNSSDLLVYNADKRLLTRRHKLPGDRWSDAREIGTNIGPAELRVWTARTQGESEMGGRTG
jgi:hypothetical protein